MLAVRPAALGPQPVASTSACAPAWGCVSSLRARRWCRSGQSKHKLAPPRAGKASVDEEDDWVDERMRPQTWDFTSAQVVDPNNTNPDFKDPEWPSKVSDWYEFWTQAEWGEEAVSGAAARCTLHAAQVPQLTMARRKQLLGCKAAAAGIPCPLYRSTSQKKDVQRELGGQLDDEHVPCAHTPPLPPNAHTMHSFIPPATIANNPPSHTPRMLGRGERGR